MEILLFGIAREIVGAERLPVPEGTVLENVGDLRQWLKKEYPQFEGLNSLAIAINNEYADDSQMLPVDGEIALIPPVSGG